jgi:hypothetical protein
MAKQLTTEDKDALALKEAFAEKQYTEGVLAGTGLDMGSSVIDYLGKVSEADLAGQLAFRRKMRAKALDRAAGSGAAERLAGAEARKTAVARDAAMKAATQAAQDPTGAAAVTIAQQMPDVIARAADTSKEETREMDRALKQKAAAEQMRSEAEVGQLMAKQAKERARFGLVKSAFESAGTLAAALKPQTYEAKQASIAERQAQKATRLGAGQAEDIRDQLKRGDIDKREASAQLSEFDAESAKKGFFRTKTRGERAKIASEKAKQAESNLAAAQQAEFAQLQQKYAQLGKLLADPVTPETTPK